MPETPGNSEMDGPWPGEGEDISNDPWPGQEEIGGGDGEQMESPEEENGSAGSDDATGGDKTAEVSSDSDLSQSAEPPAAEAEPVFSAEQEAERTRESYSEWQAAEAEKVTISRMPWLFHTVAKNICYRRCEFLASRPRRKRHKSENRRNPAEGKPLLYFSGCGF
mgnify:FL=1